MKVLISLGKHFYESFPELGQWLRRDGMEVAEQVDLDYAPPKERLKQLLADKDIYVVGIDEVDREVIEAAPNLKLIIRHGAGYNNIDLECARERGIAVTFEPGQNSESVAELAVGLMFSAARHIPQCDRFIRQDNWTMMMGQELLGKTLGLVGYGNIGRRVARIAKSLDMRILVYDPFLPDEKLRSEGVEPCALDGIFEQSDFISLHAPATPENFNMIGERLLSKMRPNACLINTARGELVDEQALADALNQGRIYAAALDVFKNEPPTGPLSGLENVIYTPHIGACTTDSARNLSVATYHTIQQFVNNQPLDNRLV